MARKIVVTSGKGGVGKTTICARLGMKLASLGFRVAILDMDIGLNNLDVVMNIENKINFDILDVIAGNCRLKQALVQDAKFPSLYVLASTHLYEDAYINKEDIKQIVDKLGESFDYVLLDCPAGVEDGFKRAVYSANEALVVVTPHISSIRDADKVLSILASFDLLGKYLIINRVRGDFEATMETLGVEEIVQFLKTKLIGVVPEDDDITKDEPANEIQSKQLDRAITLLAENLHNGTRKIYDVSKKYRGFWGIIRRNLKKRM
ncbi:MAG: septum site-determining protein MinD [Clostridiales bacterium]|nr:septum site-determining protein MinD [Clostridiales bacterium]